MRSHITRFAESPFRIFVLTARDLTARIHSFGRSGGSLRSASDLHVASSRARRRSAASPAESRDRRSEVAESSRGRRRLGSCQSRFKTRQHVNTPDGSSPGSVADLRWESCSRDVCPPRCCCIAPTVSGPTASVVQQQDPRRSSRQHAQQTGCLLTHKRLW